MNSNIRQNAPCKLCGKSAKLIKQSHIVPQFMYKGLFVDNHSFLVDLKDPERKPLKFQTGFYDKYILCSNCDNVLLSGLENYAARLLYEGIDDIEIRKTASQQGVEFLEIEGVDYKKMKRFVLSMLWRAHISNNPFFKEINIPDHEKTLRKFVFTGDPIAEDVYSISLIGVKNNEGNAFASFPNPGVTELAGGRVAFFFINGMFYFIRVDRESDFTLFESFPLRESKLVRIPLLTGELASTLLQKFGLPEKMANFFLYESHLPI